MVQEKKADRDARLDAELEDVRLHLDLGQSIVLALRDARRRSRQSQRALALATGLSKSQVARLESAPGSLRLDDVVTALDRTDFHLRLCRDDDGSPVGAARWSPEELIARDRSHRRLPADAQAQRALTTPTWFTARYGYDVPSPDWTWSRTDRGFRWISASAGSSASAAPDLSLGSETADANPVEPRPPEDPCAH